MFALDLEQVNWNRRGGPNVSWNQPFIGGFVAGAIEQRIPDQIGAKDDEMLFIHRS